MFKLTDLGNKAATTIQLKRADDIFVQPVYARQYKSGSVPVRKGFACACIQNPQPELNIAQLQQGMKWISLDGLQTKHIIRLHDHCRRTVTDCLV